MSIDKVTVLDIQQAKEEGRKLVMVTAYDYPFGLLAAEALEQLKGLIKD